MDVTVSTTNKILIELDATEILFITNEAKDNSLTPKEMIEMIFAMLFVGGYSNMVGKD